MKSSLRQKKILIFLPSLELGGSERFGLLLAIYLKEVVGAKVEVWGVSSPGIVALRCDQHGIPWRIRELHWPINPLGRIRHLLKLYRDLRNAKPDIILPFTLRPSVMCGIVWRYTGASLCVWHQHDVLGYRMGWLFEKLAVKNTSLFISNSDHAAHYLMRTFSVPNEKIRVVYNAIQLPTPATSRLVWRSNLGISENDFVVVMVANLHRNKDHATLLKAWQLVIQRLRQSSISPVLLLAGYKGDSYEQLQRLSESLALRNQIKFLGQVEDVAGLLHASDLGVLSSRSEGCPNGLLECMATGLAVVGTDIPGIRESVGPDGYEFLSPPGAVDKLAQTIITFAISPDLRRKFGAINRTRVQTVFNTEEICRQMASLLEAQFT